MFTFEEKKFAIGSLTGLSQKQVDEHLKLYGGYVKHANLIGERLQALAADPEKNAYATVELRRRFSFEWNGMRMHEYYFEQFERGAQEASPGSSLHDTFEKQYGGFDNWQLSFKAVAGSRGIGWAVLYHDPRTNLLLNQWVGDHEIGHLGGLAIIIALDLWEHAFMVDYTPAEKKKYVDAFFVNLNWRVAEERFGGASV